MSETRFWVKKKSKQIIKNHNNRMLMVMIANKIYATAALVCNYELNLKTSNYRLSHDSPHPPFPSSGIIFASRTLTLDSTHDELRVGL